MGRGFPCKFFFSFFFRFSGYIRRCIHVFPLPDKRRWGNETRGDRRLPVCLWEIRARLGYTGIGSCNVPCFVGTCRTGWEELCQTFLPLPWLVSPTSLTPRTLFSLFSSPPRHVLVTSQARDVFQFASCSAACPIYPRRVQPSKVEHPYIPPTLS